MSPRATVISARPGAIGARARLPAARRGKAASPKQASQPARVVRSARMHTVLRSQKEGETEVDNDAELTEQEIKQKEIDRLRAAEKFAMIGSGKAICKGCGYEYDPSLGDPEYPIAKGTAFDQLPEDWGCPTCGAPGKLFELDVKEVAGFAENQGYGFGSNAMTGEQKSLLIYGSLLFFFFLFLSGYFLN